MPKIVERAFSTNDLISNLNSVVLALIISFVPEY